MVPARPCTPLLSTPMSQQHKRTRVQGCNLTQPVRLNKRIVTKTRYLQLVGGLEVSSTPRPAKLGSRWMEFQGIKNWEGLLDPLDDKLREEILRYGDLVNATYSAFDFDPPSPTYATCRFPKKTFLKRCGLAETGYRVTKYLRATCGVQLPGWMEKAPSWIRSQSCWIGYVGVCQNKEEIARLGRRDVVIAFRGTVTCLEWLENLRATLTHLPTPAIGSDKVPMVETGFLSLYTSASARGQSLQEMVRQEIKRILQSYGDEPLSITITGHSLGAALATLAAYDIKTTFNRAPFITVISFAGPRFGNHSFRQQLERQGTKVLRIVNSDDIMTKVPGLVIDGDNGVAKPSWIQRCVDTKWVYAEIGREFRVSSKDSPYLKSTNVVTCHDIKTYLHLINGFVSSSYPFRTTADKMSFHSWRRHRELLALDTGGVRADQPGARLVQSKEKAKKSRTRRSNVSTSKVKPDMVNEIVERSNKARELLMLWISGDFGISNVEKILQLVGFGEKILWTRELNVKINLRFILLIFFYITYIIFLIIHELIIINNYN